MKVETHQARSVATGQPRVCDTIVIYRAVLVPCPPAITWAPPGNPIAFRAHLVQVPHNPDVYRV